MSTRLPKTWVPFFWFCNPKKLDLKQDRHLIVHTLLAFGTLKNIMELIKIYGQRNVRASFLKPYGGLYSVPAFSFAKFFLNAPKANDAYYVKRFGTSSRTVRR
jgi:hypothetical protein